MLLSRTVVGMIGAGMMMLSVSTVSGQNYPTKSIRIITFEPAGSPDFVARLVAQGLTGELRQQIIVDNRAPPVAIDTAVKAPPDGYTLLLTSGILWISPFMQNVTYNVVRDFLPVTLVAEYPNILVVHPSLPVTSVKDLIALAKTRPCECNY